MICHYRQSVILEHVHNSLVHRKGDGIVIMYIQSQSTGNYLLIL